MKHSFILFAFLVCTSIAKADCSASGIGAWPGTSTLKANPVIVLEFYATSRQIVAELNIKRLIYLRSGEENIKLVIVEVCKGQYYLTQVILRPVTPLKAGREYELIIDSLHEYERIQKWNKETRNTEAAKWKVLKEADTEFPAWTQLPTFKSKYFTRFGCGPSLGLSFDLAFADISAVLVKTTVRNTKTGKYSTYYLEPAGNKINVGHDMCAGAFDFDSDDLYEVSFALMDASGNPGCFASEPFRFIRPKAENSSR